MTKYDKTWKTNALASVYTLNDYNLKKKCFLLLRYRKFAIELILSTSVVSVNVTFNKMRSDKHVTLKK